MVDKVQLSTIRISAELNATDYKEGAAAIASANQQIDATGKQVQATITNTQQKVSASGDVFQRLSRQYIDGYGAAQKFNSSLLLLANALDRSKDKADQVQPIIDGLYKKFGLMGNAAEFAARGQLEIAAAIEKANAQLAQQQQLDTSKGLVDQARRIDELRSKFDSTYASMRRFDAELLELNELARAGVQITGGYANAIAELTLKYDQSAAAAKRLEEEKQRLAAREAEAATKAEAARIGDLATRFDTAGTAAKRLVAELADLDEAVARGIPITGGYANAVEALTLKYDMTAAAAKRMKEEQDRLATKAAEDAAKAEAARLDELMTKFDTTGVAAKRLAAELADLNEAVARGVPIAGGETATREAIIRRNDPNAAANAAATREAEAAAKAEADRVAELTARFNPAATAAQNLDREINDLAEAERRGLVTAQQVTAEMDRLILKYDAGAQAAKRLQDEQAKLAAKTAEDALRQEEARLAELTAKFDTAGTAARRLAAELAALDEARARGVPITGGYDVAREAIIRRSDPAAVAAAAEAVKEEERLTARVAELRAALDPAAAAVARMNAEIAEYNDLLAKGRLTTEEFTKLQEQSAQRHIGSQAGQGGQARFGAINAAAQLQDIAVTAQMGQDVTTIALQQGTQLGQALEASMEAGEGLVGIITGLGTAIRSLFSITNLFAIGLTAATVIAVRFFSSGEQKAEDLTKATRNSEQALKDLAAAYGVAELNADKFGQRGKLVADASARQSSRAMEDAAKAAQTTFATKTQGGGIFGTFGLLGGELSVDPQFVQFQDQIQRLRKEINEGRPDFERFFREVNERGDQADGALKRWLDTAVRWVGIDVKGTRESADALIELAGGAAQATRDFIAMADAVDRLHQIRVPEAPRYREDQRTYDRLRAEDIGAQSQISRQFQADLQGVGARSPQELAAAARAQAAAQPSSELPGTRNARLFTVEMKARIEAEQALKDAQEERDRSQVRSLATAENNIKLIGRAKAETEGLRIAYEREAEIRDTAERNHVKADEAAIARARERAMVEGQRIVQAEALSKIEDQKDQLETLRKENELVGVNGMAHDDAMRTLATEQYIREHLTDTMGEEAAQLRLNTTLINQETDALKRKQLAEDLEFAHLQRGRTQTEQDIRARLRAAGAPEEGDTPLRRAVTRDVAEQEAIDQATRIRQRQRAVEQQREENNYIGQTVTATETLRFANEELAAARERAFLRHETMNKEEEASILRQAEAMGKLIAQNQALSTIQQQRDDIELKRAEVALIGQGTIARNAAIETLKTELYIRKMGTGITKEMAAALREYTKELNVLNAEEAKRNLQEDIMFERRQMFRSTEDQKIAERLRSAGYDDSNLNSAEAQMIRMNLQLERMKDTWQGIFDTINDGVDTIVDALFDGTDDWGETLKKMGRDFARQMFDLALTNPLKNFLTGSNLNTIADLGIFPTTGEPSASSGRGGGFGGFLGKLLGGGGGGILGEKGTLTNPVFVSIVGAPGIPGLPGGEGGSTQDIVSKVFGPNTKESSDKLLDSLGSGLGKRVATGSGGGDWLNYLNQGAGRNLKLDPKLVDQMSFLKDMGVKMNVFSGGIDPAHRLPGTSVRHDWGGAADVFFTKGGRRLDWTNPEDVPLFQEIYQRGSARGVTGWGAGEGYMGGHGAVHLGGGTRAIWGSDLHRGTAADWLKQAASGRGAGAGVDTTVTNSIKATNASVTQMGEVAKTAAESLQKVGLSGFEAVKGLTDAAGGLTQFGSVVSKFMAPGGGSGAGWFQNLSSLFGGAGGAVNYMTSISPAITSNIMRGIPGLYHSGGIAGSPNSYRFVSPGVFLHAQHFAAGGIAGGSTHADSAGYGGYTGGGSWGGLSGSRSTGYSSGSSNYGSSHYGSSTSGHPGAGWGGYGAGYGSYLGGGGRLEQAQGRMSQQGFETHSGLRGGLAHDEVPAILHRGELVFRDIAQARSVIGGLYHEGGIAGYAIGSRRVDPSLFIAARRYHDGGFVGARAAPANQNIDAVAGAVAKRLNINLKNINVFDPSIISDYVRTDTGEQAMLNMMRRTGSSRGL